MIKMKFQRSSVNETNEMIEEYLSMLYYLKVIDLTTLTMGTKRAVTSKLMTKENGAGCLSRFDSSISHFCLSSETMPLCLMNVPVGGLLILRTLFGF